MTQRPTSLRRVLAAQKPAQPIKAQPKRETYTVIWRDGETLRVTNGRVTELPRNPPIP